MMNLLRAFRPIASDFLSTIVFVAAYSITGNITWGVGAGIAAGCAQIALLKGRGRKIDLMQWASLALVVVLGSATLLTRDPRFIMVKPTIGALAIGSVMLRPNWMARYLPPIVTDNVSPRLPLIWGYVWSAAVFAIGAANLFVALVYGPKIWAWFTAIVPISVQLSLFLLQYALIRRAVILSIRSRATESRANPPLEGGSKIVSAPHSNSEAIVHQ
ncbi:MAG TPA: septation protein IspZ [Rhizomicrobium sp.]|jgi:intracellular septation protein A